MVRALSTSERALIREEIVSATKPGVAREVQLYRWLCGTNVFPRRRDFVETCIFIPHKKFAGRKIVRLKMNRPQRTVEAARIRAKRAGVPFRGTTLKARQFGLSTYWLASMMEEVTRNENVRACLIADEESLAKTLLETGKVMRDRLPYRLPTKYENRQQLYFDTPIQGWIDIATAKSKNPCRGRTYSFLHATEPGTWDDPERKVASVNQAVPDSPETVLSYEGTANGTGNWWHNFWWDARNGNNDYQAFFFPWFADWEFDYYKEPVEGDAERIMGSLDDEEKYLLATANVNLGQLKWRRNHIRNSFFGDLDLFHQEFPATPEEAFLASGRPVFNGRHITRLKTKVNKPVWVGDLLVGDFVNDRLHYDRRANPRGPLSIWHMPDEERTYVISTDTAEGASTGDFSVVEVVDKESMDQVAEFRAQVGPGELGDIACCLGWFYNTAYVLPDSGDGPGGATMLKMTERRYQNIGRRPVYGVIGKRTVPRWGWDTNRQTKYLMVNEVRAVIGLEDPPEINSETLLIEMGEYEIKEDGTYGAPQGRHDDCVDAYAVVLMAQKDVSVRGIMEPPPKEPTTIEEEHWAEYFSELNTDPAEEFYA